MALVSSLKARTMVALWVTTTERLRMLSTRTGQTQIALADQAIRELEHRIQAEQEEGTP